MLWEQILLFQFFVHQVSQCLTGTSHGSPSPIDWVAQSQWRPFLFVSFASLSPAAYLFPVTRVTSVTDFGTELNRWFWYTAARPSRKRSSKMLNQPDNVRKVDRAGDLCCFFPTRNPAQQINQKRTWGRVFGYVEFEKSNTKSSLGVGWRIQLRGCP